MGPPTFGNPIVFVSNSPSAALMLSIPRCQRTIEVLKERPAFEIFCIRNENILQWRWKISYWLQPATLIEPIFRGADFHNRISEKNSESTKGLKSNDNSCFSWVQKPKIQETRKGCQYLCNSSGGVCCSTGSTLQQGRSGKCPIKKSGPLVQWTSSTAGPDVAVIIQNPWLAVSVCATRPAWWRPDEDKWFHVWGVFL